MEPNPVTLEDFNKIIGSALPWHLLAGKTLLISGANGFLPAYIVKSILHYNDTHNASVKVIGLVRNKEKAGKVFKEYLNRSDLELLVHDVTQPLELASEVHYIIHAASQASPKYYGIDPVGTLEANTTGTTNLLRLARDKKVASFLFFSSGEVYGVVRPDQIPIKEDDYGYVDPASVRSCYAESKRMGETICVSWHHQYGIPVKIVRPFHTYGPGMTLDDGRVFSDFVANIVAGQDIVLNSDGSARRAFCYLADATVAFLKVLLEGADGVPYNVGNPAEEYSIAELAGVLAGIRPELGLKVTFNTAYKENNDYLKSPISRNAPDISRLKQLGWTPQVSVKEGFSRVVDSFLSVK